MLCYARFLVLVSAFALPLGGAAATQSVLRPPMGDEGVLHAFKGGNAGANPSAGVVIGADGVLYGTTVNGGQGRSAAGTVFTLTPKGHGYVARVLHSFTSGSSGGADPSSGLLIEPSGALIGTTSAGGGNVESGFGTVFELVPTMRGYSETVLYAFKSGTDGSMPSGPLIEDANGAFYGTTSAGGTPSGSSGTVYKLAPGTGGYSETVLYAFQAGNDGENPLAGVIAGADGSLYGTTLNGGHGGNPGWGTVFKLTPNNGGYSETVVYAFRGGKDGAYPYAGLIADASGSLYGTTGDGGGYGPSSGLGTVFKLTPKGKTYAESILYAFRGGTDGAYPSAGLIEDTNGALYGTTGGGGSASGAGYGTVFELTPAKRGYSERVVYVFSGSNGDAPSGGLAADTKGALLGTTYRGGGGCASGDGCGTVYRLTL